jgi:hypothetical protein
VTPPDDKKARLIYAKSHVAIHPTQLKRDNLSGLLGLVEVDREPNAPHLPESAPRGARAAASAGKEILVVWVPDELFKRMSEEDKRNYQRVEERPTGTPAEEDGECQCLHVKKARMRVPNECGGAVMAARVEVKAVLDCDCEN